MQKVGDYLKKNRIDRGLTLSQVSSETKIKESYLTALENNDWVKLPPSTFVKGFIRNVAVAIGADPNVAVAIFRREFDESKRTGHAKPFLTRIGSPFLKFTPGRLVGLSFVFVGIIFVVYLVSQLRIFTGAPSLSIENPASNTRVSTTSISVSGKTDPNVTLAINGQQFPIDNDGRFVGPVRLAEGLNEVEIVAESKSGKKTTVKRTVIVESTP